MFSFSLLNVGKEVLESRNVRTVVCVSGPVTYETLRDGMRNAFEQVNSLVEKKTLDVGKLTVPVKFFLCGDFKYKQRVLGLNRRPVVPALPCAC